MKPAGPRMKRLSPVAEAKNTVPRVQREKTGQQGEMESDEVGQADEYAL